MAFADRNDAGRLLAEKLRNYADRNDVIVLGIPRGGVPVAYQIASRLHAPLDIYLSRKLGVPGNEELAFGALAAGDGRYLDESIIRAAGISVSTIEEVTSQVRKILNERATLYRGDRPAPNVANKLVILVDDGIATGASAVAAVHALRQMKPAMIILAVPVMPRSTYAWLQREVDKLVCLYAPQDFSAVGQFYLDFRQVEDKEVITLLQKSLQSFPNAGSPRGCQVKKQEVTIDLEGIQLSGTLSVPTHAGGLILFVHGSGSGRHSPRNQFVAQILQSHGLATLLFDLLTANEEQVDQRTSRYRFDIRLLTERLIGTTHWIQKIPSVRDLPIGYFGASTGAAAALIATAQLHPQISAVVSRGGRPDLAGEFLKRVEAAVLLIVGGKDETVVRMNQEAMQMLGCEEKQLDIVPGATHLFEEEGTLEIAARHAADWFERTLKYAHTVSSPTASRGEGH